MNCFDSYEINVSILTYGMNVGAEIIGKGKENIRLSAQYDDVGNGSQGPKLCTRKSLEGIEKRGLAGQDVKGVIVSYGWKLCSLRRLEAIEYRGLTCPTVNGVFSPYGWILCTLRRLEVIYYTLLSVPSVNLL